MCSDYITAANGKTLIRRHLKTKHGSENLNQYRIVKLQTWSTQHGNGYFTIVEPTPLTTPPIPTPVPSKSQFIASQIREEKEREQRLKEKQKTLETTENTKMDNTNDWLRITDWQTKFSGKKVLEILATSYLDWGGKHLPGETLPSSDISRLHLQVLDKAFDRIMEWCFDTLEGTHRTIRRIIRSPFTTQSDHKKQSYYKSLDRLLKPESETRYINYWKRMIIYCFRVGLMDPEKCRKKHGINFTKWQRETIKEIHCMLRKYNFAESLGLSPDCTESLGDDEHDLLDDDDDQLLDHDEEDDHSEDEVEDEDDSTEIRTESDQRAVAAMEKSGNQVDPFEQLAEKLFGLCVDFITQKFDHERQSPLCHFMAVLGIKPDGKGTFLRPELYTSKMAGMLWVNRLLMLEYALPKRSHQTLGRESRDSLPKDELRFERVLQVHQKYLVANTFTASAYMGELIYEGYKQVVKEQMSGERISWDKTGETIFVDNIACKVTDVNKLVLIIIDKLNTLMDDELLFGTCSPPKIDLNKLPADKLQDIDTPGYWIGQELCKSEEGGYRFMIDFTCKVTGEKALFENGTGWDWERIGEYLKKKKLFLQLLMLAIFLTGGQPPRGPEIGSVKFRNADGSTRNTKVDPDGNSFVQISYNKARSISNRSFHVARFLPAEVGRVLMLYTVYVRPFAHYLYNRYQEAMGKPKIDDDGSYLFCDDGEPTKYWKGDKLSAILQRETKIALDYSINISKWRHIVIGIARRYIKTIAAHFARNEKECERQTKQSLQYQLDIMFAFQAGHSLDVDRRCYAIDEAYQATLSKEKLDWFHVISRAWHHYLGLDEGGVTGFTFTDGGDKLDGNDEAEMMEEIVETNGSPSVEKKPAGRDLKRRRMEEEPGTPDRVSTGGALMLRLQTVDSPRAKKWSAKFVKVDEEAETIRKKFHEEMEKVKKKRKLIGNAAEIYLSQKALDLSQRALEAEIDAL